MIPLIFINTDVNRANFCAFFNTDANKANRIITTHCPIANKKNKDNDNTIFLETVANANKLAKIGVEQGLDAKAKTTPIKKGNKK